MTPVLAIRVWFESQDPHAGFRARITITPDVVDDEPQTTVVTRRDDVVSVVERWLGGLPRPAEPGA
ncbi:MAG TPA: hypothetical protein VE441_15480 [Mycobacterium sp.]|nr:hypothetical protein [Mycobacterium sp.]